MFFTRRLSRSGYNLEVVLAFLLAAAGAVQAQWYIPESVGGGGGFSSGGSGTARFLEGQGFAAWNLPWLTESDSGWFLQTKLNLSGGWLSGNGVDAWMGSLGPAAALGHRHFPLSIEIGFSPTLISQYEFGSVDLGQELQFTSYGAANLDLTRHWRFGYRFQHMSNGGLSRTNPGLNLNIFSLSYVF